MADDPLITELRELGTLLEVPPAPDVRAAVRARLTARPRRRRWRVVAAAVAAAVLVAVVPPARGAVAHAVSAVLDFAGVRVQHGQPAPVPEHPSPLPSLRATDLDTARRLAHFPVGVPGRLAAPDRVEVADPAPDGAPRVVTLLYRGGTVRLDEFDGQVDQAILKKTVSDRDQWVQVGTGAGIWFAQPHEVVYIDRSGAVHEETARLAGPTLIWVVGHVTYRLEGVATLDEALAVATSVG
jgi:hypothetical protein